MLNRANLEQHYRLEPPASPEALARAEAGLGRPLHPEYAAFLRLSDGLYTDGNLVLLDADSIAERNRDYEVPEYLPGYLMIGDDSGGVALLLRNREPAVFEVDMGVMMASEMRVCADSLAQLLIRFQGRTLDERQD
ncbi:SMI1/KNR4 family protein [Alcanivorax sp. 24]|uniref:SMI1/KNR4 family protein n=1 Tax=Alcanivorax sp. 24 TaxID=2545266 RepID=UPI001414DB1D|nr:SMI1/KNR4 family protein [Alcanivorax sp. 24]